MSRARHWAGIALTAAVVLPSPGTTSRDRDFCDSWLALPRAERRDVLSAAEDDEGPGRWDPECRAGLRPGLRHLIDAECRNWKGLMDFEVRILVDRLLRPCARSPR